LQTAERNPAETPLSRAALATVGWIALALAGTTAAEALADDPLGATQQRAPAPRATAAGSIDIGAPSCGAEACSAEALRIATGLLVDGSEGNGEAGMEDLSARALPARGRITAQPSRSKRTHTGRPSLLTYRATAPPRTA
jgi:hypothetical protein